jgi:uncharacterized RDD family membrane protein YckC
VRIDRLAFRPVRAAARSSRGILADEAERAIGAVFAGPMPEAVARSLVEHQVVQRVVSELLDTAAEKADGDQVERLVERVLQSPALERWLASEAAGRLAETVAERAVRSDAFRRAMTETLSSPEVRRALSQQSADFGAEVVGAARTRAGRADDSVERAVRRMLRSRPQPSATARFGGLVTRGVGLVVDAAFAQLAFVVVGASVGLVVGLTGSLEPGWFAGTLTGIGWSLVAALYFVAFWSATGQTPGMRLMGLRVVTAAGAPPSVLRSVVRFAGLLLAIAPALAGFLPVLFDRRRRALQDFLAGTSVVRDGGGNESEAAQDPAEGAAEARRSASTLS